ncbi:hypothetical protein M2341_000276 [Sphingobium sp. B7D2B]|uniref:hypothetical protein n=1 Tax=Sphingobium sp. B7D2B TaxID=2940583 RepID=UPI0022247AEF|nr:hypothetical protein [Sphingobium sp. B7D2B]MCW2364829.1 hypothetical protein [Sphingobium sp. B7D2B]
MNQIIGGATPSKPQALPTQQLHLRDIPLHWFTPSEELEVQGWPDFGPSLLADWTSSAVPAPLMPNDCCLVLTFPRVVHPIEANEGWTYTLHETGGMWQERKRIIAKKLETGERGAKIIHAIARAMAHSNCASDFASFDQLIEYRKLLDRVGLDCNHHIQGLAEGFYPIDLVEEALLILEVIDPPTEALAYADSEQLCLAIMSPNCSDL